jgi:hypothetical protein
MEAHIDATYSFTGYTATGLREAIALQPKTKINELVEKMLPLAEKPDDIVNYTIKNEKFENYNKNKPLEMHASINAPQLTEQAGPDYLFKLGDVIGDQGELYTETERKLPVDIDYPFYLNRTITINIPKGYKIKNPEAIKLHADYVDANLKPVISFTSDYTLKTDKKLGDKLIVNISEFYLQVHYPASDYEIYRKVFNTSADFNKVSLILEKKKGA